MKQLLFLTCALIAIVCPSLVYASNPAAIFHALDRNDNDALEEAVKKHPKHILNTIRDRAGLSPLAHAVAYGKDKTVIEKLISAGADTGFIHQIDPCLGHHEYDPELGIGDNLLQILFTQCPLFFGLCTNIPADKIDDHLYDVARLLVWAGAPIITQKILIPIFDSTGLVVTATKTLAARSVVDDLQTPSKPLKEKLKRLINANRRIMDGTPLLNNKTALSKLAEVQTLLDDGANPNQKSAVGKTALHYAYGISDAPILRALLEAGAHINAQNQEGDTPLHSFARSRCPADSFNLLLTAGADPRIKNRAGQTALHQVCKRNNEENDKDKAALLLTAAPDTLHEKDYEGKTPLDTALENNAVNVIAFLREKLELERVQLAHVGYNPWDIFKALDANDSATVHTLVEKIPKDILNPMFDFEGFTPLAHAVVHASHENLIEHLIKNGAPVARSQAIQFFYYEHITLLDILLPRSYAALAARNISGDAARNYIHTVAKLLIHAGVPADTNPTTLGRIADLPDKILQEKLHTLIDANKLLFYGPPCLIDAINKQSEDKVEKLLEDGANPNQGKTYRTRFVPLVEACRGESIKIVELLLAAGAHTHQRYSDPSTALHTAAHEGHCAAIKLLLSHGALINAQDTFGNTPLHKAAFNGHFETAQLLLENGADPHLTNQRQQTPLYAACQMARKQTIDILAAAAPDTLYERDYKGTTPFDTALSTQNKAVISLLKTHLSQAAHPVHSDK